MGADNYENLGFQVKIDGATDAVNHLDDIISRLERIQKLKSRSGNGHSKSKSGGVATDKQIFQEDVETAKQKGSRKAYTNLLNLISKEEQLNHIYAGQIETYKQLLSLKEKMSSYSVSTQQNVQDLTTATETAKAQAKAQQLANNLQNESFIKAEQELAVENEKLRVFKKQAVEKERLKQNPPLTEAEQAQNRYQEQQIRQMARLQAEQKALNEGKWEEAKRIELANDARKKEIVQRLKQELGLDKEDKQVRRNTNSWAKYLTKLTAVATIARRVGKFVASAIQESANYVENLNLFAVAYGETYQQQIDWALGIADAYGLASNEVLQFAGTFRELSTSLGLVGDTADLVTKTVTNLGYDLSALFNTSVEGAMEKLQSGIFSGNVRPLRAYGIDISQNQIDALFETNEALASLGVNTRNLTQSDKAIARLIITLQSGKDSFGTMSREINNLQSQFRIFNSSISNLKLAIGDSIEKPLSNVMVLVNAATIALTNMVRSIVPLEKTDETPKLSNLGEDAEYASEELENLESKLAGFDKFNVLSSTSGGTDTKVTQELNKLLEEQATLYDDELAQSMENMENKATELAKKIEPLVSIFTVLIAKIAITTFSKTIKDIGGLSKSISGFLGTTKELNKGLSLTNTLLIAGLVYTIIKAVQAFKDGDKAAGWFAVAIGVTLVAAFVLLNWEMTKTVAINVGKFFVKLGETIPKAVKSIKSASTAMKEHSLSVKQVGVSLAAMAASYMIADSIINLFGEEGRKTASICFIVAGAVMAIVAAVVALNGTLSWGTMLPVLLAGVGAAVAGVKGLTTEIKGFADGGFTNANLIMTHENGKREWVGKEAGSSAIVNDTQMSDIMEVAVAKGVYNALSARSEMGGNSATNETIVVKIGEEAVFNAVRKTARRQGRDFANV